MRDVNDSSFMLLADPGDWTIAQGVAWNGEAHELAGKQNWRLPPALTPANARAALAATSPVVLSDLTCPTLTPRNLTSAFRLSWFPMLSVRSEIGTVFTKDLL